MPLDDFLRSAKEKGASDDFLVAMLKDRGWPSREIYEALGKHYSERTGIPVPEPRSGMESAREAFFHLLAFSTLGTWAVATGNLWFELIDRWFPDALRYAGYYSYTWTWDRVAWQMASLIVAFPAFLWATRSILRNHEENPAQTSSSIRRWLTNIALFATAVILIGDLVTFFATFLQGGLTVRFVSKCIVVSVLAGAVFLYYNRGLARGAIAPRPWHRAFALGALGVLAMTLGLGFWQTGSPETQRLLNEDRQRLLALHGIATMLASSRSAGLPESLNPPRIDPFLNRPYEYYRVDGENYEICATFHLAAQPPPNIDYRWRHPSGRHCFQFSVRESPAYPNGY
jgi:hypothetical protein